MTTLQRNWSIFSAPLSLILGLIIGGCTTAPTTPAVQQVTVANFVEDALAIGLVPVLSKNPAYLAEARMVAGLLGTFSGATITPADVDAFLGKTSLTLEDRRIVASLVNAAYDTFQRRYAGQVGASMRPDVKLFLSATSHGILNAVAACSR